MITCFLMGQHDAPDAIQERLCAELEKLVQLHGVTEMIVGHRGNFDRMATAAIQSVLRKKPELYGRVLVAYHDSSDTVPLPEFFEAHYYPIELYEVPLRYAIVKANQIALDQCDFFLTFCDREGGNAGKLLRQARRMEKKGYIKVVNLAQNNP